MLSTLLKYVGAGHIIYPFSGLDIRDNVHEYFLK